MTDHPQIADHGLMIATLERLHLERLHMDRAPVLKQLERHRSGMWSPQQKLPASIRQPVGT